MRVAIEVIAEMTAVRPGRAASTATNTPTGAPERPAGRGCGTLLVVVLGVIAMVMVTTIGSPKDPFDLDSSAPNGYRALRIVLEDNGIATRTVQIGDDALGDIGPGQVLVVPEPDRATADQLGVLADAVVRGATVVYGSTPPSSEDIATTDDSEEAFYDPMVSLDDVDDRSLVELPAQLLDQRVCDLDALEGVGPIDMGFDTGFGNWIYLPLSDGPAVPPGAMLTGTCYGAPDASMVVEFSVPGDGGDPGRVIVLANPYLWANARLKAVAERGDVRPDNGLMAWRIISGHGTGTDTTELILVDTISPAADRGEGDTGLIALLPTPFKAFAVAMIVAVAAFVWSRAMRFGAPVPERTPVDIEASQFTAAIGRLFMDDQGFATRGSEAIRRQARRDLAHDVGLQPDVDVSVLCSVLAGRTGRSPTEIATVLQGGGGAETLEDVIRLEQMVQRLRMEVGNGSSR